MDKRIKRVIRDILKAENTELCFGDLVASRFFKEGQCAFFIDGDNQCCQVLLKDKRQVQKTILSLTELLGTMNQLEKDASIIILEDTTFRGIELFYNGKQDFAEATLPGRYDLSPTSHLLYSPGQFAQIDEQLFGTTVPDPLVSSFNRLFLSKVFPTAALARFVKHYYMTDAQYDTMRALCLNRIAIIVAILLGLAPFLAHKDEHEGARVKNQVEQVHSVDTQYSSR